MKLRPITTIHDKKRLVIGLTFLTILLLGAIAFILIANRQNSTDPTNANPNNQIVIRPADNVDNFPLQRTEPEGPQNGCNTGNNTQSEWIFNQWGNEQNLCQGATSDPTHCPNASMARATGTSRVCYWQNQKKFDLTVNADAMSFNGCYKHRTPEALRSPGGYGAYIAWYSSDATTLPVSYNIGSMDNLYNSANFQTAYYSGYTCPAQHPLDPHYLTKDPIGFSYMSTIFNDLNGTVLFYQVGMWDRRPEYNDPNNPISTYKNCGFPNPAGGRWIVIGEPIGVYGLPSANPGGGPRDYNIDILPRVKHYLRECLGEDANIDNFKATGAYWGNEVANTVNMTNIVQDPKLVFNLKVGVPTPSPSITPTNTPLPTSTPRPSNAPVPTSTPRPTSTPVPGATNTPIPTPTRTPTPVPGQTNTPTSTPRATNTPVPGVTNTPTPTTPPSGATPTPVPLPPNTEEDLNFDGIIDIRDFKIFRDAYLAGNNSRIDFNNNGDYSRDIGDFAIFASTYKRYV